MKYIIYETRYGTEVPIIFPEIVDHGTFQHLNPVSAGFIKIYGDKNPKDGACCCENALKISVYGKSVGLGIGSRKEDEEILLNELMRHYH